MKWIPSLVALVAYSAIALLSSATVRPVNAPSSFVPARATVTNEPSTIGASTNASRSSPGQGAVVSCLATTGGSSLRIVTASGQSEVFLPISCPPSFAVLGEAGDEALGPTIRPIQPTRQGAAITCSSNSDGSTLHILTPAGKVEVSLPIPCPPPFTARAEDESPAPTSAPPARAAVPQAIGANDQTPAATDRAAVPTCRADPGGSTLTIPSGNRVVHIPTSCPPSLPAGR